VIHPVIAADHEHPLVLHLHLDVTGPEPRHVHHEHVRTRTPSLPFSLADWLIWRLKLFWTEIGFLICGFARWWCDGRRRRSLYTCSDPGSLKGDGNFSKMVERERCRGGVKAGWWRKFQSLLWISHRRNCCEFGCFMTPRVIREQAWQVSLPFIWVLGVLQIHLASWQIITILFCE
jgi:hypothetical protein